MPDNKQKAPTPKSIFPGLEKEVLAFWEKENIFQKTLDQTKTGKPFVFFEGPPTANGKPGIHHVLARAYKDVIVRYKTMRGFYVERKAGWDTHGLPVEIQVEKELGISGKPEIEKFGIEAFNKKCRASAWKYKADLEAMTRKIGFWLDMEHPYVTYENKYIESLWWVIKQIWDKGLLYKGHKVVPHCPRCGTALSSHEVALGYKSVEENSVYVKFKVVGQENTYILSWTTTPWTLPGNVALAVGEDIVYVKISAKGGSASGGKNIRYIVAEAVAGKLFPEAEVVETLAGEQLVGLEYEPLYDIKPLQKETAYKVYAADFVNTEEGTGVVHTAVMYGEDDFQLGEKVGLPKHHTVDLNGNFTAEVSKWAGQFVKDKSVEKGIVADLRERGLLLKEEMYRHDYPFCWRCGTPLLYYAKDSWFIMVSKIRDELIRNNETINWVPGYIKHGRFGEWLNEVKDWAFSRERYWGTPLPIWECEKCQARECIGSVEELVARSKEHVAGSHAPQATRHKLDLHKPYVDKITFVCSCGGNMHRVKEVADVWFDSGAMPFAQWHYPFENKDRIDAGGSYPADFIAEGIDQTRGWFYTLLTVATLLGHGAPYKNVICLNLVFDAKGQKMSKSKGNIIDPFYIIDKFGADTLRWFLFTVNQPGDAKLFDESQLDEVVKKQWLVLWNILSFWKMHVGQAKDSYLDEKFTQPRSGHVLDKWILAKTNDTIGQCTNHLENYNMTESGRLIAELIKELSTWYVRRSRNRFKIDGQDKQDALAVLRFALVTIARLLAPYAPFMAEALYREVKGQNEPMSVHLAGWPSGEATAEEAAVILKQMVLVRQAVELGHSLRKEKQIKVRQPLPQFIIRGKPLDPALKELVKDEANVKEVICVEKMPQGPEFAVKEAGSLAVALDMTITDELKYEGMVREMIRQINAMRKDAKLTIGDTVALYYEIPDQELEKMFLHYKNTIIRDVIASGCLKGIPDNVDLKTVFEIAGVRVTFGIKGK
ncbi:MAG: isoleucine--tRNA ligase [Patescibacteria group bacterium]